MNEDNLREFVQTFGLELWMIYAFVVLVIALLFEWIVRHVVKWARKHAGKSDNLIDDALLSALGGPLSLFIWWQAVLFVARYIVPDSASPLLQADLLARLQQIGLVVAVAWYVVRLTSHVERAALERRIDTGGRMDPTTIHALARVTRIAVFVTALLVLLDSLGVNIAGLLAVGGVGGLALGLAARDLLANLFGGLTVFMDRPFTVGEWIRSPDRDLEGVVEDIGWRQTRIRRFDRRALYVPNATFTTIVVENPSRMTHRRIYEVIGVRYDDFERLEPLVTEVREMLQSHPDLDTDVTTMAYFDSYGDSSVNFFIYCFTRTRDWVEYHQVKQQIMLRIGEIIASHGAEIAYPTRRLLMEGQASPELAGLTPGTDG